jgi:hypothetical protein
MSRECMESVRRFPDNAADPQQFRACLHYRASDVRYEQLDYVQPFIFKS